MAPRSHKNGVRRRKRRYTRTTAVGRVSRNLVKVIKILGLIEARLKSWGGEGAPGLDELWNDVNGAWGFVKVALVEVGKLERKGWVPPKKSWVVVFEEGDQVEISEKHKGKYLEVYGKDVIADLVVSKVLPSGELAVKHGQRTPFIVAKSHLARRS